MSREVKRCQWVSNDPVYIEYHDNEWGVPVYNDDKIFEALLLEIFQSGLSWITILKKRAEFYKSFDRFNYKKISNYSEKKLKELEENKGIIRHKLKIKSAKTNAIAFIKIQNEFGSFSNYIWEFVNKSPIKNSFKKIKEIPSKSELSEKIHQDLKNRGFKFVGSITIYSFMQAVGIVNDHTIDCFRYNK